MPTVLVCQGVVFQQPGKYSRILEAAGFEIRYPEPGGGVLSEAELAANLHGVDATIASMECYSPEVLRGVDRLRVISRCGVGLDSVDLAEAARRGVLVGITPNCNHEAVAEHTLALLLSAAKRVPENHAHVAGGGFTRRPTHALRGKTLGLVGQGRIAGEVARRASAFGLTVIAHSPSRKPGEVNQHGVRSVTLDVLWRESDYLSLHAPLTTRTQHLVNAETLALMKDSAILINTSRGGLIDEQALAAALCAGRLAGAAVDVYTAEPPTDSPLLDAPHVIFSPHIAGADHESFEAMVTTAAQTIADLYQGRWPADRLANADDIRRPWIWAV